VTGGAAILEAGSQAQKENLLSRLANGDLVCTLALTEPGSWYGTRHIRSTVVSDGDACILNGTKLFVENAHISDFILCVAVSADPGAGGGLSLLLVDRKSPGIECTPLETLSFEKHCRVVFDNVRVPRENFLGQEGAAGEVVQYLLDAAAVGKCAEMVGEMGAVFEKTVAHAKDRRQFGRSIGSFQAVQHHCANMVVDVDGARFLTYQAAWRIANRMPAAMEASMAKAWTSAAARRVTALGHQIHGAVSFCEEDDLHLYYRKAKASETAFGDGNFHLEKIAGNLL
jgi:alkylation response protein AidB-like acyl-CoA dehydrogenase